ncbi:FAD-dependent oxidoreductase [Microlunatus speluncae]|uniref:FAD-dependent oxidoreductase n=1 Tax=Microlunatus speluncae TaxID=2594267 RepID=UPI0012666CEE|nr:FAD-dependent oxidoreductase [Microlunatus speluncae]
MGSFRVAVVGAGPAGIYAAAALAGAGPRVSVDLFDRLPTPYGLVRYGTAPDHPRIKEVVVALRQALAAPGIRFFGNVDYGADLKLAELRELYHAVIFATGATGDRRLEVPGIDLPGSYGAADFVSWYNGHPDAPRTWPLDAAELAVIGAGNVALDVARMLAKPAAEQLITEIPDNVERCLAANRARDVHLFARRGPAEAKFTPLELRELAESPNVDVIVDPDGAELTAADELLIKKSRQRRTVTRILRDWVGRPATGAPRRLHLHFRAAPVAVLGGDRVIGLRTERTESDSTGMIFGTGEFTDRPVQAVYRAIGYRSTPIAGLPFDQRGGVIPNLAGRVVDLGGEIIPGIHVTGWVKRGPVGLIGHTKSDAAETIAGVLAELDQLPRSSVIETAEIGELLRSKHVDFTTLREWDRLDAHELALGRAAERQRIKIVDRADMIAAGRDS